MRCSYPSFATVCNLDGTPVLYGFVSYVHMSTLMYDKDIGSTVRRTVLDCDRGSRHNCRITALEYLLLLVGEDIAYHQQCEQAYRPVEAHPLDNVLRTEQVQKHKHQCHYHGAYCRLRPTINTCQINQRLIPCDKEHLLGRGDLIYRLALHELQVKPYVTVAWRQFLSPFVCDDGLSDVATTVIGIAQIVIKFRTLCRLYQLLIVDYRLLIVAFLVFCIGVCLCYCNDESGIISINSIKAIGTLALAFLDFSEPSISIIATIADSYVLFIFPAASPGA